jgi:hypothetical protein
MTASRHSPVEMIYLKKRMRNTLIAQGLEGMGQSAIKTKFRTHKFSKQDVQDVLDDWLVRGLVQRFKVKTSWSDRPTIIWRATERIRIERL